MTLKVNFLNKIYVLRLIQQHEILNNLNLCAKNFNSLIFLYFL